MMYCETLEFDLILEKEDQVIADLSNFQEDEQFSPLRLQ